MVLGIKIKPFVLLVGNVAGSLDSYAYAALVNGDPAFGNVAGLHHSYTYDTALAKAATESPYYIVPADNGTGTGAWVLQGFQGAVSHVSATRSTSQLIPNVTDEVFVFTAAAYNSLGEYNTTTGRLDPIHDGFYSFKAAILSVSASWTVNEYWEVGVRLNGSSTRWGARDISQTSHTSVKAGSVAVDLHMLSSEYAEIVVRHTQGASVNSEASGIFCWLSISRLI